MSTVLVSGASGIVGYGVLRSLRATGAELLLIGTSIHVDSVAQGFCDIFEEAPLTSDDGYIAWLARTIQDHRVDLLIPGIEADMYKWSEHRRELENAGARLLLNDAELIASCKDKWTFYQRLVRLGTSYAIDTSLSQDYRFLADNFGLPFLLKPRRGFGSKGIVRIGGADEFSEHRDHVGPMLMAQPIVGNDDDEYTASAFGDGTGGFRARMCLRRKLSRDGFTEKGEVVESPAIDEALSVLCRHFRPLGPTNFQFRTHEGTLKLLEINPRISSSTSLRAGFGYNESLMAVEYFLQRKEVEQPAIRRGRAVRYSEDFFFYETGPDL